MVIDVDTVWSGEVVVSKDVLVKQGFTLTIEPGTTVRFARERRIWVDGNIVAVGQPDKRILFTALEKNRENRWHQIMSEKGMARLVNCDFEYADMAFHCHFSDVLIENCSFSNNEIGIRFKGGPVLISKSLFEENVYGIVPNFAQGQVVENIFTGNSVGILVRAEKDGGLVIRHNNFFNNSKYNLQMGAFNMDEDVDARENWWGKEGPRNSIFDERQEDGVGRAVYEPYAEKAFELKVRSEK